MAPVGIEPLSLSSHPSLSLELDRTTAEADRSVNIVLLTYGQMITLVVDRQRITTVIYTVLCRVFLSGWQQFHHDFDDA